MSKATKAHYIDNSKFLEEMKKFRSSVDDARLNGTKLPRIPEYVGECFIKIANNLSHKPNFLSYTFRDEMISDAIENSTIYAANFDPKKSSNPFAYFTQIAYYAFLRRIQREKKQLYVKYKSAEISGIMDEFEQLEVDGVTKQFELYDNITEFIGNFESARKAKKQKKSALDKFLEEDAIPKIDELELPIDEILIDGEEDEV